MVWHGVYGFDSRSRGGMWQLSGWRSRKTCRISIDRTRNWGRIDLLRSRIRISPLRCQKSLFPFHSLSKLILSLVGLSSWPVGDRKRVRKRRWINYVSGTGIKPRKAKTDFGLGSEEKTFWYWQTRSRRDNPEDGRTTQQEKNCGIADKYRAIEN